jgi:hypothetical protein
VAEQLGLALPVMREVAGIRHQFDQPFVIDAGATTDVFGLAATPWDDVARSTVAGTAPVGRSAHAGR